MIRISPVTPHCLVAIALAVLLAGCSATLNRIGAGGGNKSQQTASVDESLIGELQPAEANSDGQVDIGRFYGSGYCPKIEIRDGTEALRTYTKPKEPSQETIIWQASISETARQCREDPNGKMAIKLGVSGRVLAGPKGGPENVTLPIRVAVVKYKEAVLASELYKEQVTIGANLSTVFRRVYQIEVPSPGKDRDYIIYVGFDNETQKNRR